MALKAGASPLNDADFAAPASSMAAMIEDEFERAWTTVYDTSLGATGLRERRILFVAVARGVLRYLVEREGSSDNEHFADSIHFTGETVPRNIRNVDWNVDDV